MTMVEGSTWSQCWNETIRIFRRWMMGNVLEKNMFPVIVQQKIDNYQKQAHKICQCKKTILKF